jgi:hypothetical protein
MINQVFVATIDQRYKVLFECRGTKLPGAPMAPAAGGRARPSYMPSLRVI